MLTEQMKVWSGQRGKEYTDRSSPSVAEWEQMYVDRFGITRTAMNSLFLEDMDRDMSILEVGCNVGNQLVILQNMGFTNLHGIELQHYAVEQAKRRTKGINIIQGSALNLPFKDNCFDMVFTSGVLIHFTPEDIGLAIDEIYLCSKQYIWGYEYYADKFTEINWRGLPNMMFKADYKKMYLTRHPDLSLYEVAQFGYLHENNTDEMFLLKK